MKREIINQGRSILWKIEELTNMLYSVENSKSVYLSCGDGINGTELHFLRNNLINPIKNIVKQEIEKLEKELEEL